MSRLREARLWLKMMMPLVLTLPASHAVALDGQASILQVGFEREGYAVVGAARKENGCFA